MLTTSTTRDDTTEALDRLMTDRFSCRAFRPDPVPDQVIGDIFQMARHAASWCNTQPWDMIVTRPGTTEPLAEALTRHVRGGGGNQSDLPFPPEYRGDFLARRRAAGFALYGAVGIVRGDDAGRVRQTMENFRFFGAPHVAIMTTAEELGPYGLVDCGGFLANFLLAARAHGVDTIPQAALAQCSPVLRDHLGIPEGRQVVCGVSFGYADLDHPANGFRTERRTAEDLFRFADA